MSGPNRAGRVVVVGTGVLVPGASSPEELWSLLLEGEPVFREPGSRFAVEDFWSADRGAEDRTYSRMSGYVEDSAPVLEKAAGGSVVGECARWLRHCLAQASRETRIGADTRVSCFSGQWVDGNQELEEAVLATLALDWAGQVSEGPRTGEAMETVRQVLRRRLPRMSDVPRRALPDAVLAAALDGLFPTVVEQLVVDTACASSLYAIDLGARALTDGQCDLALCGGVYQVTPRYSVMFSKVQGLSPSGTVRSFDQGADGTLFSDGAAVIALKRLETARADGDRILAVLHGFGAACDGAGKAVQAPNPAGQRLALARAGSAGSDHGHGADWILAHGTATPVGDSVELTVLQEAGDAADTGDAGTVPVTSNKSLIGHTGWAAGAVSVVHAVEALRHGLIPGQRQFERLPAGLAAEALAVRVPTTHVPWPPRERGRGVGVSGFGFGGTNAHLRLGDTVPSSRTVPVGGERDDPTVLVAWSRLTQTSLQGPDTAREIRLVPRTLREIDPVQARAVLVTRRFAAEHGALWDGLEDRTGVLGTFWEPPRRSADTTVRVYQDVIGRIVRDLREAGATGAAQAVADGARAVRARSVPVGPDTLAGVMPNVTPARIANRENLHGLSMAVCDGPDSFLACVRTAHRYLTAHDLDLVLVLAGNGNTEPWAAAVTGVPAGELRETTVVLALTRESTARDRAWPVTARVSPSLGEAPATADVIGRAAAPGALSADGVDELLRALEEFDTPFFLPARRRGAGCLRIEPVRDPVLLTARHVPAHVVEPAVGFRAPETPLPPGCLVLTDSYRVARLLAADDAGTPARTVVCTAPGPDDPRITYAGEVTEEALLGASFRDVRLICAPGGAPGAPPRPETVRLQELGFLAARALWESDGRGSFLTVCLDAFAKNAPRPHTALLRGMARSLVLDLPECRVATVLTDATDPVVGLEQVAEESGCRAELQGTRIQDGLRRVTRVVPAPLPGGRDLLLGDGSVVVATGGARGITGACLEEIGRHARPHLWLLGRSLPEARQLPSRTEFLRAWLGDHPGQRPADAGAAYSRLQRACETRHTVERLRTALGADRVHYLTCDVTDAVQVKAAARRILSAHPRIDLLLHGAGVNRSAAPGHKTLADFRFVSAPKITGYHHLKDAFGAHVDHWCSFGSVSGALGQPGEADYAAANDYLAACAELAAAEGHSEFTFAWTLWRDVGMGASPLRQALGARRAQLSGISPQEGRTHFLAELTTARPPDPLVLNLGDAERRTLHGRLPLLLATGPGEDAP